MNTVAKSGWAAAGLTFLAACGGGGGSASSPPPPPPPPPPANTAPTITSDSALSISENQQGDFYTFAATDSDGTVTRLELIADTDASFFTFDPATGQLSLEQFLSFDAPSDADANNTYALTFEAEDDDGAVSSQVVTITVTEAALKAALPPSGNFELIDWKLDLPTNSDGELSGASISIGEVDLDDGYTSEYFFTGPDGGMVLKCPVVGATTSGSSFSRVELREMLRRGDSSIRTRGAGDIPNGNNWALSSQPLSAQANAGGIDGTLRVEMAVNSVTTTGSSGQVGRIIIGQIHAKDDEPIRLYYRKLPDNERGAIYAVHELAGGADTYFEIIGERSSSAPNPADGFLLDERFSYDITTNGNLLTVQIFNDAGTRVAMTDIDMSMSGYDVVDDFMYFKAGAYHVNNTADADEFAQVTIYELSNTHVNYPF